MYMANQLQLHTFFLNMYSGRLLLGRREIGKGSAEWVTMVHRKGPLTSHQALIAKTQLFRILAHHQQSAGRRHHQRSEPEPDLVAAHSRCSHRPAPKRPDCIADVGTLSGVVLW